MNKKFLLVGAVAVAACFVTLTAFDKKTREQQRAEIDQQIQMQLDQVRSEEAMKCNERVTMEAQTRYMQVVAEAEAIAAKTGKPAVLKPKGRKPSANNTVTPMPQPTPPPTSTPKQEKMDGPAGKTEEKKRQMDGPAGNTESKRKKMDAPGGGN